MRYAYRLRILLPVIVLAQFCQIVFGNALCFAQSNQIQRLPQKLQQRIYSLLDQIQNAYSEGNKAALDLCNSSIAEFPQIGEFYLRRGYVYSSLGNGKKALSDYRHARFCDPMLADSAVQQSSAIYSKRKDFELALKELDSLPVSPLGFRGSPEDRIAVYEQMGNRSAAESTFREYRRVMIARGQWSDIIKERFPTFANLALEEQKPSTVHTNEATAIIVKLAAFESPPTKSQIEKILSIRLVPGKSSMEDKYGLVGKGEFFQIFVDERNKQAFLTLVSRQSFIAAKDLLKDLNYKGEMPEGNFFYYIRRSPSDPKMITLDFSGEFKGLSAASFSWNVAPDSPRDGFLPSPNIDSPQILMVLKKLDIASKPIDKSQVETITRCKLRKSENVSPEHFYGMTETEKVWRSGNGFSSQKSWSVYFTPNGSTMNDSRLYIMLGSEKVTREGLDTLLGPGVDLQLAINEWRIDSQKTVSYKRPYGSITAVFPKQEGNERIASGVWFWWKEKLPYATLEEFESKRTSTVLCKQATEATCRNEFRKAAYLLRLAYMRGGFSDHSGQEKYKLWQNIRASYVDLYEKKGDTARASYLRNINCQKMNSDLLEMESLRTDFPTLKEAESVPWQINHPPEGISYRLQGDNVGICIYRSSPNFRRCVELFGPMNSGADLFVKSIPADLFDSEYFGPAYYD